MAVKRDYYDVLGVPRDADDAEIKRAFRRLAQRTIPTSTRATAPSSASRSSTRRTGSSPTASGARAYDMFGHAGVDGAAAGGFEGFGGGFGPFGDIFDAFFGGAPAGTRRRSRVVAGADLRYDLTIEFAEAVFGVTKEISFPTLVTCTRCEGSGGEPGTRAGDLPRLQRHRRAAARGADDPGPDGEHRRLRRAAAARDGSSPRPCTACGGDGRVREERTLQVTIPGRASTTASGSRSRARARRARAAARTATCTWRSRFARTPSSSAAAPSCTTSCRSRSRRRRSARR